MEHSRQKGRAPQQGSTSRAAAGPAPTASPFSLLDLQESLGNQGLLGLLASGRLQAKLAVNQPGDACEQEADRVAQEVVSGSAPPAVQRKATGESGPATAPPAVNEALGSSGQPLDPATRAFLEPRFGRNFEDVRVHTGERAAEAANSVGALAFTVGRDVVFGDGQYAPGTTEGRQLLSHELTHVVQQQGAATSLQRKEGDKEDPPKMTVSGDTERKGPAGGVAITKGSLEWRLKFVGQDTQVTAAPPGQGAQFNMVLGKDVLFEASFTPAPGTKCPTITFSQTVQPTIAGLWDTGPLLYTRSPASGASMDVKHFQTQPETDPFYGVGATAAGPGLKPDMSFTAAGSRPGASPKATQGDAPYQMEVPKGATAVRKFETAVICVETAETFGSIVWGYTKTGAGVVTLQGATPKDVRASDASADFETTRQAFYTGFFQLSLDGFATGSAALTPAHKAALDQIDVKDLTRVILAGANDNSGGPEANAGLSLQRAQAARDYLVKTRGVSASILRVEGHGVEARVPNPPGKDVPANRRVDVHLQRGAETSKPAHARSGSASEQKRILKQNPRITVNEAVDTITRLDSTTGRISMAEWSDLNDRLGALDGWRAIDPTVPDLRKIYGAALKRIEQRAQFTSAPARPPLPKLGPISPEVDDALRRYEEAKKRVEDLKRQRDSKKHRLDEMGRELLEEP
jgi:outer membrane protein OmpA-like peptidoglycan-associated protein